MLLIYSVLKFLTGRELPFLALETVVPSNGNSRFS